jgi:hypothetical protein
VELIVITTLLLVAILTTEETSSVFLPILFAACKEKYFVEAVREPPVVAEIDQSEFSKTLRP